MNKINLTLSADKVSFDGTEAVITGTTITDVFETLASDDQYCLAAKMDVEALVEVLQDKGYSVMPMVKNQD